MIQKRLVITVKVHNFESTASAELVAYNIIIISTF